VLSSLMMLTPPCASRTAFARLSFYEPLQHLTCAMHVADHVGFLSKRDPAKLKSPIKDDKGSSRTLYALHTFFGQRLVFRSRMVFVLVELFPLV